MRTVLGILALAFALTLAGAPQSEPPLTNQDIIKLAKLKLSDDVIIAKVKQAATINFDLSTDGLVQLKQAAVSDKVIGAMLEQTTPKTPPPVSYASPGNASAGDNGQDVRIVVGNQAVSLPSSQGDISVTGMWPVVFTYLDYPGLHARVRTHDARPTLTLRSSHDPTSYFYLVKLDENEDDNNRSLKITQKGKAFTGTTRVVPAENWAMEYAASESAQGTWQIVPNEDLQPGEYGVVIPGGILYEFGRD